MYIVMNKYFLLFIILIVSLNSCYGCAAIKEHFAKRQVNQTEQGQQPQEQPQRKVEPIPVNPQHS